MRKHRRVEAAAVHPVTQGKRATDAASEVGWGRGQACAGNIGVQDGGPRRLPVLRKPHSFCSSAPRGILFSR